MPGRLSVPTRRTHSESDDAEDSDNSSVSVPGSASSKRRRLSDGSASPSPSPDPVRDPSNSQTNGYHPEEEEEEEDEDEDDDDAPANFQPGSIVRVKLTNFVTYTKAEFHLGPSLNMIIGPNGTGKSTLVCAICLGLGWPPKHLGRAKDAAEFVKHGQKEAEIEIELQAGKGQKRNPVIRRRIRREGNKSTYTLNKDQVPEKDIRRLAQSFSIQIDNLCQFLPQDRVVEFAGLSPIALLEETERAAAPPVVYEQHQQLKKFHEDLRKEEQGQKQNRETLTNLQNRQNAARADVERLQERQSIQEKVGYMEKYRPFIRYAEARDRANEAKRNKKNAERDLAKLQENLAPQLQAMETHQGYVDEIKAAVVQRQKMVTMAESKASKVFDAQLKAQNEIDLLEKEKAAEKQRARGRAKRIQESEEKIKEIRQQMNEPPIDFDPAEFNARKRAKQRDVTEIETNKANLQNRMGEVADKVVGLKRELQSSQRALDDLHSKEGQQVNKLRAVSKDSARAWEWIQGNRDKFQGQVFGPPIVECSVKDKKYAKALENSVGKAMTVFTVTNQHDFRLALDQLTGRDGLGLSQIEVQSVSHPSSYFKAPISREDLPEHGLAGWALDYIEGPDEVLSMLCENAQLHRSGISFGKINEAQHDRLMNSPIQRWLDQQSRYTVTKRYGRTAVGSSALREAQIWADSQVDAGASHEIKKKITEIKGELELLKEEEGKLAKNMKGQDLRLKDLEQEIGAIEEEKSALQRARTNFNLLPQRLESEQEKMNPLIEANDEFRIKINKWIDEQDDLALQRAAHALDYAKNVNHLQTLYDSLLKAEIILIEAGSELACLTKENEQTRQVLEQTAQEVQRIAQDYSQIYNEAKRQHKLCNDAVRDRTEEEQQFHDELAQANTSSETLEAEISAMQARLELLHGGGGANTLRDYEKRQADIENYARRLEDTEQRVAGVKSQIKETQEKWEPVVDRLVEQISDAFSHHFKQIDCAGQVVVHKDENFEKWAIQIQVKFRANEPLSNLDASRQSGGERAVSTIFYLLSLQSLARSPFRVVDEINQGMDPRNERKVHERMVDIACKEHTSQYFLVTPKLLHGLKYHKRMKVHCIASGEHMPKDGQKLDFMELAQIALRVKAAA